MPFFPDDPDDEETGETYRLIDPPRGNPLDPPPLPDEFNRIFDALIDGTDYTARVMGGTYPISLRAMHIIGPSQYRCIGVDDGGMLFRTVLTLGEPPLWEYRLAMRPTPPPIPRLDWDVVKDAPQMNTIRASLRHQELMHCSANGKMRVGVVQGIELTPKGQLYTVLERPLPDALRAAGQERSMSYRWILRYSAMRAFSARLPPRVPTPSHLP